MRRAAFAQEEIDDIQETAKGTILVIVANRDERYWDTAGNTNCVLDIEIRLNTGIIGILRILAIINSLKRECRAWR